MLLSNGRVKKKRIIVHQHFQSPHVLVNEKNVFVISISIEPNIAQILQHLMFILKNFKQAI